jgi:hypothetical protein
MVAFWEQYNNFLSIVSILYAICANEQVPHHTVAAVPRWEPETAWEPETVNRKSLQMTKSVKASPALKNWR